MYSPLNSYLYKHWILDFKYIYYYYILGQCNHTTCIGIRNYPRSISMFIESTSNRAQKVNFPNTDFAVPFSSPLNKVESLIEKLVSFS